MNYNVLVNDLVRESSQDAIFKSAEEEKLEHNIHSPVPSNNEIGCIIFGNDQEENQDEQDDYQWKEDDRSNDDFI